MLEPLTIAFVKPLLCSAPWKVRHLPAMEGWEKSMSGLQWLGSGKIRDHMRKFWSGTLPWKEIEHLVC